MMGPFPQNDFFESIKATTISTIITSYSISISLHNRTKKNNEEERNNFFKYILYIIIIFLLYKIYIMCRNVVRACL